MLLNDRLWQKLKNFINSTCLQYSRMLNYWTHIELCKMASSNHGKVKLMKNFLLLVLALLILSVAAAEDCPAVNHDNVMSRNSPQTVIGKSNVNQLQVKWILNTYPSPTILFLNSIAGIYFWIYPLDICNFHD